MATLQKLDLLSMGRLKTTTVDLEGGQVVISELGAADSSSLFANRQHQDKDNNLIMSTFGPALLVRCIVDDEGNRLFADDEVAAVGKMRPEIYIAMLNAALDLNGLSAKSQDQEIKN